MLSYFSEKKYFLGFVSLKSRKKIRYYLQNTKEYKPKTQWGKFHIWVTCAYTIRSKIPDIWAKNRKSGFSNFKPQFGFAGGGETSGFRCLEELIVFVSENNNLTQSNLSEYRAFFAKFVSRICYSDGKFCQKFIKFTNKITLLLLSFLSIEPILNPNLIHNNLISGRFGAGVRGGFRGRASHFTSRKSCVRSSDRGYSNFLLRRRQIDTRLEIDSWLNSLKITSKIY